MNGKVKDLEKCISSVKNTLKAEQIPEKFNFQDIVKRDKNITAMKFDNKDNISIILANFTHDFWEYIDLYFFGRETLLNERHGDFIILVIGEY